MKEKPHVGQLVFLNDEGIEQINGLESREAVRQAARMRITAVEAESLTDDVGTWLIEVDAPLINEFLIDNHCVDLLEE